MWGKGLGGTVGQAMPTPRLPAGVLAQVSGSAELGSVMDDRAPGAQMRTLTSSAKVRICQLLVLAILGCPQSKTAT